MRWQITWCFVATAWFGATVMAALPESFETGIPPYLEASRPGSVRLSDRHSKHGYQSLRWDWRAGEMLVIRHGLGDIRRQGGYGGTYGKATFGIWLYQESPTSGSVQVLFRVGETSPAQFTFPLDFQGWRRAHLRYSWRPQFEGTVSPDTDNIALRAPAAGSGTVFIDLLTYNGILDYRQQHVPGESPWTRPVPDPDQFPLPAACTPAEREALEMIARRFHDEARGSASITEASMTELADAIAAWRLKRTEDGGITGRPIVRHPDFYSELGLVDVDGPKALCTLMLRTAQAHANSSNTADADRLADWYLLMSDHIHDQGMTVNAGFPWGWYDGRDLASATFLMRDVLQASGRLERDRDYFDSNYGISRVFDDSTIKPNMDYFHNDARNILRGALMQGSEEERVRSLRAVSRRLTRDILYQGRDGFRPDGSTYHHNMHYFAYANYSMNTLCTLLAHLAGTPFQVSPKALERVKTALLNMRFYCNFTDLPLPLCGRHPHSQSLGIRKYLDLAVAAGPGPGQLDSELVRAYLRFAPEEADQPLFAGSGLAAEPHPQGLVSMPHAGLLAIRHAHWLALIKGYSRHVRFGEIYARNNRFGRYLSHGYLDILAGGQPVNRTESGCDAPGWDWNRLDGTTVVVLPEDRLRAVSSGTESIPTDEVFCGAAVQPSLAGVFGLALHGAEKHDASFRARKSYHWIPDQRMIVCLGSGITCDDPEHPVQTTLFQKALASPETSIQINGRALAGLDGPADIEREAITWILDPQQTGYLVPAGQKLSITRRHQTRRNHQDTADTEGLFACAWLDHGTQPRGQTYTYAVIPACMPETLRTLARAAATPDKAPFRVLRLDETMHALEVTSPLGRCVTAAAFAPTSLALPGPDSLSVTVASPALLVLQQDGKNLVLSATDPDLRLDESCRSQAAGLVITLSGSWQALPTPAAAGLQVHTEQAATVLTISCVDGQTQHVRLRPQGNP